MANPRDPRPIVHTKKHLARLERERNQTRLILGAFIGVLVVVAGLLIYGYLDQTYFQARRPVARVGEVTIPLGQWQARVRMERSRLIGQLQLYQQYAQALGMDLSQQEQQITNQLDDTATLGQTVLDQMVDEELVRQESAKRGITASSAEVDNFIQASFNYYPSGTPTSTITPTAVSSPTLSSDTLALITLTPTATVELSPTASTTPTPNPSVSPTASAVPSLTPTAGPTSTAEPTFTPRPTPTQYTQQGFEEAYKNSVSNLAAEGLTEPQLRQLYEYDVLHDKLFRQITADVPHTEDEVWARHILVADEDTANKVRARLLGGENFATVAAEVSTDTGTKDKGGDLGWFGKGAMVPEFETAAFSLKVGEISQPVKSQFGYHIIQVLAHTLMPLDETKYADAQQRAYDDWLQKARDEYKVVTYDNWRDAVPTDPAAPPIAQSPQ